MKKYFEVLDGWRGISILFVLAGHLLPLGPHQWQMNEAIAATGMVIFFILSGFLITNLLIRDQNIAHFLIRRFMRIIPLAWLVLIITLWVNGATVEQWLSNMLFYANWPPMGLISATSHFWSLCLEIQFYISIAFLVFLLKKKAFWLIPVGCLCITFYRLSNGAEIAINTYYRLDEILSGCILALIHNYGSARIKSYISQLNLIFLFSLLVCSAHPKFSFLNYFRPYFALLLVGSTLFSKHKKWYEPWLKNRFLFFMAGISYALYVIHGGLRETWLTEGDTLEKYIKRPLFFLVTFVLAFISTRYYEQYWINLGKKLTNKHKK